MFMFSLDTEVIKISRVGESTAKRLKKLGIETARDLLFYFPFRYDDFTKITKISELQIGTSANVVGQIELIQNKRSRGRGMNITEALIGGGTENLKAIWFNQPFITRNLRVGDKVSLAGKVEDDYGGLAMKSPVYEKIQTGGSAMHTQGLVPNYHLTANLTQKQIRFLIKQVIDSSAQIIDWLPFEVKKNAKLMNLPDAARKIHFPADNSEMKKARERLAFDELFLIQLQSRMAKKNLSLNQAPVLEFYEAETKKFVNSLPFKLTDAQRKAAWEILRDMEKAKPMSRLLQGDVGSGKTVVALIAMLNAALNKKQSVLMAPTEILAKQHYNTACGLLKNFNIKIGLITMANKSMSDGKKYNAAGIAENSAVIIGTHALIQEDVKFENLALAVVDEQHRFGVEQRKILLRKNSRNLSPHLLSMTATPIPRSLALALYGDLDLSAINQMPAERKKIITKIVSEDKRAEAYEFAREQIKSGRQVFIICPLIDIADKSGIKSVEAEYEKLDKTVFSNLAISKLHGKMKSAEKEKIMKEFLDNKINILVSTSIVEVGVDIPNAGVMMIESADRFGLAQIHQFRGRVGRSEHQSYCFLFTGSKSAGTMGRLKALVDYSSGFELANLDLKFRGPGEFYGTEQKGFPKFKIASLFDYALMKQARDQAEILANKDENLSCWPMLKKKFEEWEKSLHFE